MKIWKQTTKAMMMTLCLFASLGVSAEDSLSATNAAAPQTPQNPMKSGITEVEKPLEVTGQSRNLSMLMSSRRDKDQINFLTIRNDYKDRMEDVLY